MARGKTGQFTFKTLFWHNGTLLFKVSNKGTQYVDYSKEHRNQIQFCKRRIASGQLE